MTPRLLTLQTNDTLRIATRFAVVGFLGTLIDVSLFALLHLQLGATTLLANTFSYTTGIVNNYLLHRNWTFSFRPQKSSGRQFAQFAVVSLSALVLNNLVVLLLTPALSAVFPDQRPAALIAKLCAVGVGMSWNFLANHLWTFRG